MSERTHRWRLLRTKTDETADDPDWAGTNTSPTEPIGGADILVPATEEDPESHVSMTAVEIVVLAVTAARVPVNRGTGTVDVQIVQVIPRDRPQLGGTPGDAVLVVDSAAVAAVPLNRPVTFALNGSQQWTVRLTNDATLPGATDRLEVWYRESAF